MCKYIKQYDALKSPYFKSDLKNESVLLGKYNSNLPVFMFVDSASFRTFIIFHILVC